MPLGKYTLSETEVPKGYYPLKNPVVIEVGVIEEDEDDFVAGDIDVQASIEGQEGFVTAERVDVEHPELGFKITIRNDGGVSLPSTGGPGTRLFTILGAVLALGAGGLLLKRRRHA